MANTGETFLDAIAGLSGKTAFEVWESGNNWSEIIKNAESVLGKQSKWTVLADEAGNAFQIVGKNGKYINIGSAAGAAEEFVAGNQLVTDVVLEESGALTSYTGDIVAAGGEVTKKGLALGASTGAKALMGGLAAFGAISTGVNWYKENPQFWTDVSAKLLPFGFADPTDKSWGEIFQEALVPTAVDSAGTTYVQAKMLETMYDVFSEKGLFDASETVSTNEDKLNGYNLPTVLKGLQFPVSNVVERSSRGGLATYSNYKFSVDDGACTQIAKVVDGRVTSFKTICASKNRGVVHDLNSDPLAPEPFDYSVKPVNTEHSLDYGLGVYAYGTSTGGTFNYVGFRPDALRLDGDTYDEIAKISYLPNYVGLILLFGTISAASLLPNTSFPNGAPNAPTLPEAYPDWYKNAVTTVNPNWKPGEPESEDNQKYVTWLPFKFPDEDVPDGETQPDETPEDAQSGKPSPDSPVKPSTDTAYKDGVLPNPVPDPETEPSTGTTPDIPNPPSGEEPTPDVPIIAGGTSNALWKIYNPSQEVLQQFGAWLWSSDPVKMIKELFSNNPADGIIGLHMIYVTPPVGGTSNIVVGYVDSGVASNYVSQQYVPLDCGSVTIPLRYQSALDFGYTKVYCYLPFIGIVPLDSFDVIGKTIHIKYMVDVLTGTVLAQISADYDGYNAVLYTFNGSCSVEYPLTSGSRASQMLSLITGAVGGAVVGGIGGALLGGARGALTGADVRMSGNLAGNAGAMGIRKPYIIVKRPVEVAAQDYNSFYGYPSNITGKLASFSGYTRIKDVHVDSISGATADEKREIESLLRAGIIIS